MLQFLFTHFEVACKGVYDTDHAVASINVFSMQYNFFLCIRLQLNLSFAYFAPSPLLKYRDCYQKMKEFAVFPLKNAFNGSIEQKCGILAYLS